jgi:hypothetical protein
MMTEQEMRALIQNELTAGVTSQLLNTSMRALIDATHQSFAETMKAFEITAGRISVQEREGKKSSDEIERILGDCQTFVQQVKAEQDAGRATLALEFEASHTKQQAIVSYVESLQLQVADLKLEMEAVNAWFKETAAGQAAQRAGEVETRVLEFTAKVDAFERDMWQLNQNLDSRLGVLNATVGGLQASQAGLRRLRGRQGRRRSRPKRLRPARLQAL